MVPGEEVGTTDVATEVADVDMDDDDDDDRFRDVIVTDDATGEESTVLFFSSFVCSCSNGNTSRKPVNIKNPSTAI